MRTGRALTVSRGGCLPGGGGACLEGGCVPGGGVPAWRGGACLEGGCLPGGGVPAWRGGCLPGGGVPAWRGGTWHPPPVDRITDACKNITLAKTSFRPVIIRNIMWIEGRPKYLGRTHNNPQGSQHRYQNLGPDGQAQNASHWTYTC